MEDVISSRKTSFSERTSKFAVRAANDHGWFSPRQDPIRNANAGKAKESCTLARIFHELLSRDHEDGCATWQPQGVGSEAYLNGTSQGPTPEDARKDCHIRDRSK